MATIKEIREMILGAGFQPRQDDIVLNGELKKADGTTHAFQLHHGWDFVKANSCDIDWGLFNMSLMKFIDEQKYDETKLAAVLGDIQIDDHHWEWLVKSCVLKSEEYDWFFLMCENKPQGACVIYHPKTSFFDEANIFYVEFVAVAPWNRKNPMAKREFNGVGSMILKHAIEYATKELNLRCGFSLHAIEKAIPYYTKIGMVAEPTLDKERLKYLEMPESKAIEFVAQQ
jgi:hypothetical protein